VPSNVGGVLSGSASVFDRLSRPVDRTQRRRGSWDAHPIVIGIVAAVLGTRRHSLHPSSWVFCDSATVAGYCLRFSLLINRRSNDRT